jgi:hypothetical protein
MAKALRCYFGFHRWQFVHVPDGDNYKKCRDCGKEKVPPTIRQIPPGGAL